MELDSVQIGVDELEPAALAYEALLGFPGIGCDGVVRFQMQRGAVELQAHDPGVRLLRFSSDKVQQLQKQSLFGVAIEVEPRHHAPEPLPDNSEAALAIDHIVIRTGSPERAIELWRDTHGLRLAFDREFPTRGLRLLFFRSAGITLEYAAPLPSITSAEPDQFYGLSYRVPSIERAQLRLRSAGADVSDVRPGHRPGSLVCTVRSGTFDVPTLLIERPSGP